METENTFAIRRAAVEDLDALVEMRVAFLRETRSPTDEELAATAAANRRYLAEYLPRDDFAAWVAEADGQIIGTGAIVYYTLLPRPTNLSGKVAYLLQMYTVPEWRRRGVGKAILDTIVAAVQQTDARCITLYAMEDGQHLYEKVGFQYRPDNMQLTW